MALSTWSGWGGSFLYQYTAMSYSPVKLKTSPATSMPPIHMSSTMIEREVKAKAEAVEFRQVDGLIPHLFENNVPFKIDDGFISNVGIKRIFCKRPMYMIDKLFQ